MMQQQSCGVSKQWNKVLETLNLIIDGCIRLVDTRALARNRKAIEQGDADADIIVDGCISMDWTRREKNDSTAIQM